MMTKKTLGCASIIALMVGVACSSNDDNPPSNPGDACSTIENDVKNDFDTLAKFVAIETYRTENWANEDKVTEGMEKIYAEMKKQVDEFNAGQKTSKLNLTRWEESSDVGGKRQEGEPPKWRVFKISLGSGARRVAIATHLDTVAPGDAGWQPFTLQKKTVEYNGKQEEFWLGRGSIDDKGPAVATLQVIKNIAKKYDGSALLNDVTVELIFDTSEETAMSMPNYFRLNPTQEPNLAVIFDASWCVRAEKGVERPIFTIKKDAAKPPAGSIWIDSFSTPAGPANQIPDTVTAIIKGVPAGQLDSFVTTIKTEYDSFQFPDDANYRRAELSVTKEGDGIKLVTKVAGAQHGSKPEENRADGANPLVSLANFLAVRGQSWAKNDISRMLEFVQWTWGTKVFGEGHPTLQASDEIFKAADNNGTTYAVTRFDDSGTDTAYPNSIVLKIDIRYAQDHHGSARWNGQTEGFIDQMQDKASFSKFRGIFGDLIKEFQTAKPEPGTKHPVDFTVKETRPKGAESPVPPDVRKTDGPTFSRISNAYKEVMGQPCPAIAIGGGTDAKNHANFLAAGALFGQKFGPPINFHGLSEGAPVSELTKSAKIICQFLDDEVKNASKQEAGVSTSAASLWTKADHELH